MEINVNEDKKIVEIWLSNEEKNNNLIKEKLKEYMLYIKKQNISSLRFMNPAVRIY